ncbi:hypothetical protein BaRGS_00027071 [Batillaria attramentaria]|uniref:DUF4476 domain-containing protein n=1 Tax=Batillaria attramentaria TaxID=370345 RepID=A0ABD0K3R6_9CAEN
MAKEALAAEHFQVLYDRIQQETDSYNKKLQILYASRGYFNSDQASVLLHAISRPADKLKAVKMLEPRLCRMSCQEARDILTAINIHNDRLIALDSIKRVLTDYQTTVGEEYILSTFPFEGDKKTALAILRTVRSDVADKIGAGGHQGYASLGGLYTQARPLHEHLYGSLADQALRMPGHGKIEIPPTAQKSYYPSIYTGHPSYAYPPDVPYEEHHGYPGTVGFPARVEGPSIPYPGGAPPLGNNTGAPAPTGFPRLDSRGFVY